MGPTEAQMHPPSQLLHVLAADFCCQPQDLLRPGVVICEAEDRPGRRRFPLLAKCISLVTMGSGVVICCDASRLDWARQNLLQLSRDDLFAPATIARLQALVEPDGQTMDRPELKFVCSAKGFKPASEIVSPGIHFELFTDERVRELYPYPGFNYAIRYRQDDERPDRLACAARASDQVVGIAGATADSDCLWQVGIKVLDGWHGRGIGKVLVSRLTQAILSAGKIPYYTTWPSHIVSQRLAGSVGYKVAWVELCAR